MLKSTCREPQRASADGEPGLWWRSAPYGGNPGAELNCGYIVHNMQLDAIDIMTVIYVIYYEALQG